MRKRWWFIPGLAIVLAAVLNLFILVNAHVPSGSMEPTIPTGAMVLGNRTAYHWGQEPKTGDVIFFYHPELGKKWIVKRVIAVPGQTFALWKGRVYLDGQLLDEGYVTEFSSDSYPETVVPEDSYLVLGDHRCHSNDSRFWRDPFVRRENILGRAIFVYFPKLHRL